MLGLGTHEWGGRGSSSCRAMHRNSAQTRCRALKSEEGLGEGVHSRQRAASSLASQLADGNSGFRCEALRDSARKRTLDSGLSSTRAVSAEGAPSGDSGGSVTPACSVRSWSSADARRADRGSTCERCQGQSVHRNAMCVCGIESRSENRNDDLEHVSHLEQ